MSDISKTQSAAKSGVCFLSFLIENFSGQALSKLVEAGAHPVSVATDIRNAYELLQGIKIATEVDNGQEEAGDSPEPTQSDT